MTPRGRRTVRVATVGCAGVFGLLYGVAAITATRAVDAADPSMRSPLVVVAVGAWLKVVGTVGLYVCTAVGFRDWPTFALPFAPALGRLGRRSELRRAGRQIDGEESYDAAEVARLRAVASYRVALVAHGTGRTARAGSVSLIMIFVGMLLQPLDLGHVLDRVYQVLAVVMIVVLLASLPFTRKQTDEKAQLFLLRTTGEA